MSSARVLVVGQGGRPSGYARVIRSLVPRLRADDAFTLHHFAIDCRQAQRSSPWIIPNRVPGDPLGRRQLPALLGELRPDLVWMCHDPWLWNVLGPVVAEARRRPRTVFYCPVEWPCLDEGVGALASADQVVAYTEFGRRALDQALAGRQRREVVVVPHGVDRDRFRPVAEPLDGSPPWAGRRAARRHLFPGRDELVDAFVVLNGNRNTRRKRLDLTLAAFAEFGRGKPDAWLYLHTGLQDCGVDVVGMATSLGIADRLLLDGATGGRPDVPDEELALVYNAADVGVNTSSGEGWGLVAFEHAATGAAQILPDVAACRELWGGVGILAPNSMPADVEPWSPAGSTLVRDGVVDGLERLYADRHLLGESSRQALRHARSDHLSWDAIARRWTTILDDVLG